ncbi:hypothetical protein EG830_12440 [bacterium]|nr:hypothetical protein [bacterium]
MKRIISTACLVLSCLLLEGQGAVGSWDEHLPYSRSYSLAAGGGKIYSSTGSALLVYDYGSGAVSSLSRVSGLNETAIAHIAWCDAEESLVIVYKSTGIDILKKGVITYIPDIKNKYIPGLKEIYGVTVYGSRALLTGSFGIVVIDIRGRYVSDTWRPGPDGETNSVNEAAILGDRVYAATSRGVWSAPVSRQGLSYFGNWERLDVLPAPDSEYTKIVAAGSALMVTRPAEAVSPALRDSIFLVTPGQPAALISSEPAGSVRALDGDGTRVIVSLLASVRILTPQGAVSREITTYG